MLWVGPEEVYIYYMGSCGGIYQKSTRIENMTNTELR